MILIIITVFAAAFFMMWTNSIRHGRFYLNHRTCITAGYLFYVLLPLFLLESGVQFQDSVYQRLRDHYMCIPVKNKLYYIFVSFVWLAAFFMGCRCKKIRIVSSRYLLDAERASRSYRYLQKGIFLAVLLFELLLLYRGRSQLFTGYAGDITVSLRGTLYAGLIILFSLLLLNYFARNERGIKAVLKNKWGIFYIILALLVLTTGGRLYVVSNLVALMIAVTYLDGKGIPLQKLAGFFAAALLAVGFIGSWRLSGVFGTEGVADISFESIFYNILQEPLYTNFSIITYLAGSNVLRLFSFPKVFFSSWINMVPSIVMPDKANYILTIADREASVSTPLGALHYFTTFNIDFGFLFAALFFFALGYWLSRLERKCGENAALYCTVYVLASSNLMFTLYRDPVSVSVIKNIFEFSIMVPAIVSWACAAAVKKKGI